MARKRGPDQYRPSEPSLSQVLAGQKGDKIVLQIVEVKESKFGRGEDEKTRLLVIFKKFEKNAWFPNSGKGGSVERLFAKFGDDLDEWVGELVPLVRVRDVYNPQTGEKQDVFHAARLDEWDALVRESKKSR